MQIIGIVIGRQRMLIKTTAEVALKEALKNAMKVVKTASVLSLIHVKGPLCFWMLAIKRRKSYTKFEKCKTDKYIVNRKSVITRYLSNVPHVLTKENIT